MLLTFPPYSFRTREIRGREQIWDELRRQWLPLTPEELVRRHLVRYMAGELGADPNRISQEYSFMLGRKSFRADVVLFDQAARPLLLAECKAPRVAVDNRTLAQAIKYNSVVGARYLLLTNGLTHFAFERESPIEYRSLDALPDLSR